jgi:hypothetical protein
MRPYRALLRGQGTSIADLYWAGCIINMSGFDLRQAQDAEMHQMRPYQRGAGQRRSNEVGSSRLGLRLSRAAEVRSNIVKQKASPDSRNKNERALDALQEAREMPPGGQRTDALKKAGLLRYAADNHGLIFAKRGRSRK